MFKKAIELNPNYASAYKNLGLSYDKLKRYDKAEEAFKRAVELNPEYKNTIRLNRENGKK